MMTINEKGFAQVLSDIAKDCELAAEMYVRMTIETPYPHYAEKCYCKTIDLLEAKLEMLNLLTGKHYGATLDTSAIRDFGYGSSLDSLTPGIWVRGEDGLEMVMKF